ncbi:MAG: hypothetical protein ACRDK1_00985, partial [Solirubrobacterales bacterium]
RPPKSWRKGGQTVERPPGTVSGMSQRASVALAAAATFIAGFGVAELTGVRAIGGLVLLAGGAWCGRAALSIVGPRRAIALLVIALALFVISHPLGRAIGAWPAVAMAAIAVAGATGVLLDRPRVASN